MSSTREVSLQTLATLEQAETDIDRLMSSGEPKQVAVAFGFLLRLLHASTSRMEGSMRSDRSDVLTADRQNRNPPKS